MSADFKALEARLQKRGARASDLQVVRDMLDREIAALMQNQRFDRDLAARRDANPAAMSPVWGLA